MSSGQLIGCELFEARLKPRQARLVKFSLSSSSLKNLTNEPEHSKARLICSPSSKYVMPEIILD